MAVPAAAERELNLTDLEPVQLQEVKKQLDQVSAAHPPSLYYTVDISETASTYFDPFSRG